MLVYVQYVLGTYSVYTYAELAHQCRTVWQLSLPIPPRPYYKGERGNNYDVAEALFDPDCRWFVRPQLFFHYMLRHIGTKACHGRCNR